MDVLKYKQETKSYVDLNSVPIHLTMTEKFLKQGLLFEKAANNLQTNPSLTGSTIIKIQI